MAQIRVVGPNVERLALAFLVLERRRPVAPAEIAQARWNTQRPDDWPAALQPALERIGTGLDDLSQDDIALTWTSDRVRLKLPPRPWVDIEHSHRSMEQAVAAMKERDLERVVALITPAVVIGQRPFLPGIESSWVNTYRARHEADFTEGLLLWAEAQIGLGVPDEAVRVAELALGRKPLHEPSFRALMRALDAQGNRAAALQAYENYRVELARMLGTAPSPETDELADELRSPTSADLEVLTPREQEVAFLVAEGLTNREIAGQLFISVQTAETHVKHILTKLGLSSRTQVAAWATARGLAGPTAI